jgi:hypothetical protein
MHKGFIQSFELFHLQGGIAMPLHARIPTVEFHTLLLPPIRVTLRTLQSLYRPQRLRNLPCLRAAGDPFQSSAQRRCLTLYKAARSSTTLGQHKVIPFARYEVKPPGDSAHEINLVGGADGKTTIADNISLEDAYNRYIRPGQLLYLAQDIVKNTAEKVNVLKEQNIPLHNRTFGILESGSITGNHKDFKKGKGQGALRVVPIAISTPSEHFKRVMDGAYQFVDHGSPVEFAIAIRRNKTNKLAKLTHGDPEAWPWVHDHFPHLRPDFILKSMPEGSRYAVEPVSDGRVVQFVIIKPSKIHPNPINLTGRLFKVKASVQKSIDRGQQSQLPTVLRQQLLEAGNKHYSPTSGLPVDQGLEDVEPNWHSSTSVGRYLPIKPKFGPPSPTHSSTPHWIEKMRGKRAKKAGNAVWRPDKLNKGGILIKPRAKKTAKTSESSAGTTSSEAG